MKRIDKETKQKIRSQLMQGWYGYQIAESAGVSEATVNKIRKELKREGHHIGYDR